MRGNLSILRGRSRCKILAGMSFVADDLGAWLIALLADAGRKKLTHLVFGTEQERALQHVATSAIWITAEELRPGSGVQIEELAMVVRQVFSSPLPEAQLRSRSTLLEEIQAGISGQLAPLNDRALTGTENSSAEILDVPVAVLHQKLTGHLVRQILDAGRRGGPLTPLADQLNHDATHLQGLRVEGKIDRLTEGLLEVVARLNGIGTLQETASSGESGHASSSPVSAQQQEKVPSSAWESLKQEKIILEFENGINLIIPRLLVLLEDYHPAVIKGDLSGFTFSSVQIVPEFGSEYRRAKTFYTQYLGREGLQVQRLERDLVEGVRILLDITFIREMQTIFSIMGLVNFARLMLYRSIALMRSRVPEDLDGFESFRGVSGNPLSSDRQAAQFYGHEVVLIDLWDPKDPRHVLKCWLPRDGYAGSWFSQGNSLPPDGYSSHYHPPEHYRYVLPQAVARFLLNGDPVPVNFNEYMIGLS